MKKWIISIVVLLVLAGMGLIVWSSINQYETDDPDVNDVYTFTTVEQLREDSDKMMIEDREGFLKQLDEMAESTSDLSVKAGIYNVKGQALGGATGGYNYAEAVKATLQAEEADPSVETASMLAFYYKQLGMNSDAIEYYRLAMERLGDREALSYSQMDNYDYFELQIQELGGE
jgi:tetratricopeptide (TPR) repeat protein